MKKVQKYIPVILLIIIIGSGCRGRSNQSAANTPDPNWETAGQNMSDDAGTDGGEVKIYNSTEEFYLSLPELSLPLTWNDGQYDRMQPVPPGIYMGPVFGFEYELEIVKAARLPEKDGVRSVIIHVEDLSDYITRYFYSYPSGNMENPDRLVIYNVREIDGGQNTLITSADIALLYDKICISLTTTYKGNGADGKYVEIPFEEVYYRPEEDGKIEPIINMEYGVMEYTEEMYRDEEDGEYYGTYKFTVTTSGLGPLEDDEDAYEMRVFDVKRYMLNDESWLIEVESFK